MIMRVAVRRLLVLLPLSLLLAGAAATAWLVTTEAGLVRAIALLEAQDTVRIRIDGAEGRLIGPLSAREVIIGHRRATIRITGLTADHEPLRLLGRTVAAASLHAARVSIELHPRTGPARPPAFTPRWLRIAADGVVVDELVLTTVQRTELRWRDLRGSLRISPTRIRFERLSADAGNWAISAARGRILAGEPLDLRGESQWTLLRDRSIAGHAIVTGDLDRLAVRLRLDRPGSGNANVTLTSVTGELRWQANADLQRLDPGQWLDNAPFGPLHARLDASGDRDSWQFAGLVQGAGLPDAGLQMDGEAAYSTGVVTVPRLAITQPGSALRAEANARIAFGDEPRFDLDARWSALTWPLAGAPIFISERGELQAQGWREATFRLDGRFRTGERPALEGGARGRLTDSQLIIDESSFTWAGARFEAAGMLGRDAPRPWTLSGRAQDFDPAMLRADLSGRLSFGFAASGAGLDASATWAAAIHSLAGRFRGQRVAGQAFVRRQPQRWEFERVALSLGPAQLRLDGHWDSDPLLEGTLVARDLSAFLPELSGQVEASLRLRDTTADATLTGRDLAWHEHRAAVLSADARIHLDDREYSWLRLRTAGLQVAGQALAATRLSLDGLLREHQLEFRSGVGEDAVDLRGRGAWTDARYVLDLLEIAASGPRAPPYHLEAPARLTVTANDASLTPACFVEGPRRVCSEGHWRRGEDWSLAAHTKAFPLEALDLAVPGRPHYQGLLAVDARLHGSADGPWLADLSAEISDATFRYLAPSGREQTIKLGRTLLALDSNAERHHLGLRVIDAEAAELSGEIVALREPGQPLGQLPVSGYLRGTTGQLDLLPLLVADIDRAAGRLALDLTIGGRVATPTVEGEIRLQDGALDFYQANLRLREIAATLVLEPEGLALRARAEAGEGQLQVHGNLSWRERRLTGRLTLTGERLLLADLPEARVLAAPDLRFEFTDHRVDVTGTVTIPEARIRPADTAGAVLTSTDERIGGADAGAETERIEIHSDVRLLLGERVALAAWGLSGRATGALRLRARPYEAVTASGDLEIHDARYRAYTRELEVERGRLLFTGGPVTDPGVDLRASRSVPGYKVGVIVRGLLRRPQLTLYSEPSLPQAQIASLLIVGRTLDSLQADDRGSLLGERDSLVTQGGALLAGQLGRQIGLDDVGLAQQAGDSTALVLGKFLSPRLYISYGISLVDEINTFKLRYTIGDHWAFSAETGQESAVDVEYRIAR